MSPKRKRLVVAAGILSVTLILVTAAMYRETLITEWHIWRLESSSPATVLPALRSLEKAAPLRALPHLLDLANRHPVTVSPPFA